MNFQSKVFSLAHFSPPSSLHRDDIAEEVDILPYRKMKFLERVVYVSLGVVATALCLIAVFYLVQVLSATRARAHDHERPDLNSWYPTLRSAKSGPCCDGPKVDANHLEDPDWQVTLDPSNPYRVHVPGHDGWILVSKSAVVEGVNRDGRALVWLMNENGEPAIRCFMPGSLT